MINAHLLALDLAALRTLLLVHRHKSFSAAATELGIKQSSVSYTIDRIRRAVDDPLFVRQGGGITPTERCLEAVAFAARMLSEAEALGTETAFDPAQATGTINIVTGFYVQSVIMPEVLRQVRRAAKGLRIRFQAPVPPDIAVFERDADLAILPIEVEANGLYRQTLTHDHDVVVMDPANPLAQKKLDVDAYANAHHVSFELGGAIEFKQVWMKELEAQGYTPKIVTTTYDGLMLGEYVSGTDLLASLASRSARLAGANLRIVESPLDTKLTVNMYWAAATDRSPMNMWLRNIISEVAAQLDPPGVG